MCCGRNKPAVARTGASMSRRAGTNFVPPSGPVSYFEYRGRTGLTVTGPGTGVLYRFPSPGSRVAVDPRDRQALAAIPQLIQVRS